jgi:hypothetical protein
VRKTAEAAEDWQKFRALEEAELHAIVHKLALELEHYRYEQQDWQMRHLRSI